MNKTDCVYMGQEDDGNRTFFTICMAGKDTCDGCRDYVNVGNTTGICSACGKAIWDETNVGIPTPDDGLCHDCARDRFYAEHPEVLAAEQAAHAKWEAEVEWDTTSEPPF